MATWHHFVQIGRRSHCRGWIQWKSGGITINSTVQVVEPNDGYDSQMPIYQITVQGHLDESWAEWFDHLTVTHQTDGTTILTGAVQDQVRLFTILLKIRRYESAADALARIH